MRRERSSWGKDLRPRLPGAAVCRRAGRAVRQAWVAHPLLPGAAPKQRATAPRRSGRCSAPPECAGSAAGEHRSCCLLSFVPTRTPGCGAAAPAGRHRQVQASGAIGILAAPAGSRTPPRRQPLRPVEPARREDRLVTASPPACRLGTAAAAGGQDVAAGPLVAAGIDGGRVGPRRASSLDVPRPRDPRATPASRGSRSGAGPLGAVPLGLLVFQVTRSAGTTSMGNGSWVV